MLIFQKFTSTWSRLEWDDIGTHTFPFMEGDGHVTELVSVMEGEWSCYRGEQFNGGRVVMLQRWPVKEEAWSCYRGD